MTKDPSAPGSGSALEPWPSGTRTDFFDLASGIRLHCAERGSGPPVIFLHGFPELGWSWRHQLSELAGEHRLLAPDLRGFGKSDQPRKRRDYGMEYLCRDVVELADAAGIDRFHLVGHDWGGAVAWETAARHGDRLLSLAVLNCPHPWVMWQHIWSIRQLRRSWYMFWFQIPGLPERSFRKAPQASILRAFHACAAPGTRFGPADLAPYVEAARTTGLRGGIQYYRAAFLTKPPPRPARLPVPTRLIWGMEDPILGPEMAEPSHYRDWIDDFQLLGVTGAGHWVQQEDPQRVNGHLAQFWDEVPA